MSSQEMSKPGPSTLHIQPLPFQLDFSCPIDLPSKPVCGAIWPWALAGPACACSESLDGYVRRRYLETLYLSDVLCPLPGFVMDLHRLDPCSSSPNPQHISEGIKSLLLSLPQIEARHRKTLRPILSAVISSTTPGTTGEVQRTLLEDDALESRLTAEELGVLRVGIELRTGCRKAVDGGTAISSRRLGEELERRETLLQIVLLMVYMIHAPLPVPKKRKRDRRRDDTEAVIISPIEDPVSAMELLMDRLSVWQAVAELGIGLDEDKSKGKEKDEEDSMPGILKRFWEGVMVAFFLAKLPELCGAFHQKVFGQPFPTKLLPPPTSKKARKPKHTRARPSLDAVPSAESRPAARPPSRPPSERASPERDRSLKRSASRAPDSLPPDKNRRSRSRSKDPIGPKAESGQVIQNGAKRPMIRAPSGKDLFKGREVGIMRRTNSIVAKKESQGGETQRLGLLGRKSSDEHTARRQPADGSQGRPESLFSKPGNAIIFATPSKPRIAKFAFGSRTTTQIYHSTPNQEEPSSRERPRPSFIAETPVAPDRIATINISTLTSMGEEQDDDDPLGELMVMTDEEEEDAERPVVAETPAR